MQGLGRLQDSAFGDLIVPIIVLLLCLVSLGIGIGKVANNASGVPTLLLPVLPASVQMDSPAISWLRSDCYQQRVLTAP